MQVKKISRRKLAQPKAIVNVPATVSITFDDVKPIAWFAGTKVKELKSDLISSAHLKLELTELELVARGFAEARALTIDEFLRRAILTAAKTALLMASKSKTDYRAAFDRMVEDGVHITASRLAKAAGGNRRSAVSWLAKNGTEGTL